MATYVTIDLMTTGRREFLKIASGVGYISTRGVERYSSVLEEARGIVRSGVLGDVAFCRVVNVGVGRGGDRNWLDTLRFVLDAGWPSDGATAFDDDRTIRFQEPAMVVAIERARAGDTKAPGITVHGELATLRIAHDKWLLFRAAQVLLVDRM